jgi:hypothetical protein
MILIYSIIKNDFNINSFISKLNNYLNANINNYDDIITCILFTTIDLNIMNIGNVKIKKMDTLFFNYKEYFSNYNYCIEVDQNTNLNTILNYTTCQYISLTNTNTRTNIFFTSEEIEKIQKINKNVKIDYNQYIDFSDKNIKFFNIQGLNKLNWFNTIQYLYDKCIEFNIDINNEKLLVLYYMLYSQYINFIEIQEDEVGVINVISEVDVVKPEDIKLSLWLIKKTACKQLLDNRVQLIENTYLKKDCVKKNKHDPFDKIYVTIGKRFKLSYQQNLNHFFIVEHYFS